MKLTAFFKQIEEDSELFGVDIDVDTREVTISTHKAKLTTVLSAESIYSNNWDTLQAVLKGDQEPVVLAHMSRVVGYYSRIENWNKSKQGELKDRQKGLYTVEACT